MRPIIPRTAAKRPHQKCGRPDMLDTCVQSGVAGQGMSWRGVPAQRSICDDGCLRICPRVPTKARLAYSSCFASSIRLGEADARSSGPPQRTPRRGRGCAPAPGRASEASSPCWQPSCRPPGPGCWASARCARHSPTQQCGQSATAGRSTPRCTHTKQCIALSSQTRPPPADGVRVRELAATAEQNDTDPHCGATRSPAYREPEGAPAWWTSSPLTRKRPETAARASPVHTAPARPSRVVPGGSSLRMRRSFAGAVRPVWHLILWGVPTRAEGGQPAVNDLPASDVMVGCGEAVMIGISAVTTALTAHRRATSCLVRRVTADTQRAAPAGRHGLADPEQPRSRARSHQKETAREEEGRRV